jgi:hypothetical protein
MTNEEFYIDMVRGSEANSELRKQWVLGIIKAITKNQHYKYNGENPKLDNIYEELVKINVKYNQEKGRSQVRTLIKKVSNG